MITTRLSSSSDCVVYEDVWRGAWWWWLSGKSLRPEGRRFESFSSRALRDLHSQLHVSTALFYLLMLFSS